MRRRPRRPWISRNLGRVSLERRVENTSYTLEQLDQMTDGILSMFNDYMMYSAQEYATNDAGVEVYEDTYDENGEYVDVYQKAREDQKTYLMQIII